MTGPQPPDRPRLSAIDPALVGARLRELRERLDAAARSAGQATGPELLVASKYFEASAIPALVAAGATLLGENRADVLEAKQAAAAQGGATVQWDYIGELQSRKARAIAGQVRRIHTLASASAARKLRAAADEGEPLPELLVQVNVAGEAGKGGVAPAELPALLQAAEGLPVRGLMTMPPLAASPADSAAPFAALRELAEVHGLTQLSMGTSQDAVVAAEQGATVVRLGGVLMSDAAWQVLVAAQD